MTKYSTEGLTYAQRRVLQGITEAERAAFVRDCRLENTLLDIGSDPRAVVQARQELAEFTRPLDPTGIDCHEAYEGAGDQA